MQKHPWRTFVAFFGIAFLLFLSFFIHSPDGIFLSAADGSLSILYEHASQLSSRYLASDQSMTILGYLLADPSFTAALSQFFFWTGMMFLCDIVLIVCLFALSSWTSRSKFSWRLVLSFLLFLLVLKIIIFVLDFFTQNSVMNTWLGEISFTAQLLLLIAALAGPSHSMILNVRYLIAHPHIFLHCLPLVLIPLLGFLPLFLSWLIVVLNLVIITGVFLALSTKAF